MGDEWIHRLDECWMVDRAWLGKVECRRGVDGMGGGFRAEEAMDCGDSIEGGTGWAARKACIVEENVVVPLGEGVGSLSPSLSRPSTSRRLLPLLPLKLLSSPPNLPERLRSLGGGDGGDR